ncbi:MAG TPA: tetratricopeptide repeat protein [Candidatus Binatia bacterium]|nr:tetratricopeptide repeat protein [Candidatus Binatia bacterium]
MSARIFISHASGDRRAAETVAAGFEARGLRCWIAPRDVPPGMSYADAILEGLDASGVLVLLLSSRANASRHVHREVERAVAKGMPILPVRIEAATPAQALEYLVAGVHWIDAFPGPLEAHLEEIVAAVRRLLTGGSRGADAGPRPLATDPRLGAFHNAPPRNPLFTGREDLLERVHRALAARGRAALTGLPGVGKTDLAVEYAYRYREAYRTILWSPADSPVTLASGLAGLAVRLGLPQAREADERAVLAGLRRWFDTEDGWLLILDNADDPAVVRDWLGLGTSGRILLTTRALATGGLAERVEVDVPPLDEAAALLLRRAGLLSPEAPVVEADADSLRGARVLAERLGRLPLALEQAAAFIEAAPSTLTEYLELYSREGTALRAEAAAAAGERSVRATFGLAFRKLEARSPAAAALLRLCAFLAPDEIPEEIVADGAAALGEPLGPVAATPLGLLKAVQDVCRLSLLRRNPAARTLTIHRLVQAVVEDEMDEATARTWAERAIHAVSLAFPEPRFETWERCGRLASQAIACAELAERWDVASSPAARLFHAAGVYLRDRARYAESGPLLVRAIAVREALLGPDHLEVGRSVNALGALLAMQGRYDEARPLFDRACRIFEGSASPADLGRALHNLGVLAGEQARYADAEAALRRAWTLREQALGPEHPDVATTLHVLGALHLEQGHAAEAEALWRRAVAIREAALEPGHPDFAVALNSLAILHWQQGDPAEAERLLRRALAVAERALGAEHPRLGPSLDNLGILLTEQGRYVEAETLLRRGLEVRRRAGAEHYEVGIALHNLADLLARHPDVTFLDEAERLAKEAIAIWERLRGPDDPYIATGLLTLAAVTRRRGRPGDAAALCARALVIREKTLGPVHPDTEAARRALAESGSASSPDLGLGG